MRKRRETSSDQPHSTRSCKDDYSKGHGCEYCNELSNLSTTG